MFCGQESYGVYQLFAYRLLTFESFGNSAPNNPSIFSCAPLANTFSVSSFLVVLAPSSLIVSKLEHSLGLVPSLRELLEYFAIRTPSSLSDFDASESWLDGVASSDLMDIATAEGDTASVVEGASPSVRAGASVDEGTSFFDGPATSEDDTDSLEVASVAASVAEAGVTSSELGVTVTVGRDSPFMEPSVVGEVSEDGFPSGSSVVASFLSRESSEEEDLARPSALDEERAPSSTFLTSVILSSDCVGVAWDSSLGVETKTMRKLSDYFDNQNNW